MDNYNNNKFSLLNELNIINGTASLNSNSPSFSSSGTSTATSSLVLTPTNGNGNVKFVNNNNTNNGQIYKINGHLMNLNDSFIQIDYDNHRNMQNGHIKCSTSSEFKNEINNNKLTLNTNNNKKIANQNVHSIANGFLNKYPRVRQNSMSKSTSHFN